MTAPTPDCWCDLVNVEPHSPSEHTRAPGASVTAPSSPDPATPQWTWTTRLWRCEACGKWSHAKRRPQRHLVETAEWRAWTAQDEPDNPWSHHGMGDEPEQFRTCGPFAEWSATPAEEAERHLAESIARTKRAGELRTEAHEILAVVTAVADENDELRRLVAGLEAENDNYHADLVRVIGERDAALAKVEAVKALHQALHQADGFASCRQCGYTWPCPTVRALAADPQRPVLPPEDAQEPRTPAPESPGTPGTLSVPLSAPQDPHGV